MDAAKTKTLGPRLAVGFGLGGIFLLSLINPWFFIALISVAGAAAGFELSTALRGSGWHVPRVPVALTGLLLPSIAYLYGAMWQWLSVFGAVVSMVIWRGIYLLWTKKKQSLKQTLRDFGASAWATFYVPLLISFSALTIARPNGTAWIFGLVFTVVAIDSFGYLVGRFFGKTKLSPTISPKKTWEGLFASAIGAILGGVVAAILTGNSLGFGVVFGVALLVSSVMGDLSESLIKRDLEVKDMGDVLPGHGGVMDRLDSLLPSSFLAYLLSHLVF